MNLFEKKVFIFFQIEKNCFLKLASSFFVTKERSIKRNRFNKEKKLIDSFLY